MKVLISEGYGAGWSTWANWSTGNKEMAIHPKLIEAVENGATCSELHDLCEDLGFGDVYMGGYDGLVIEEVPAGVLFSIKEYDGHEYIEEFDERDWIRAV